jgi:predicted RecB family endonuclease
MGAQKRLQRLLDKANKDSGNTTEALDSRDEVNDVAMSTGDGRMINKMEKLKTKVDAQNAAPKMVTPLYKKMTCWKGYVAKGKKKSPSGKRTKSGKIKMVNNCVKK